MVTKRLLGSAISYGSVLQQEVPDAQMSVQEKSHLRPSKDGAHVPWLVNAGGAPTELSCCCGTRHSLLLCLASQGRKAPTGAALYH